MKKINKAAKENTTDNQSDTSGEEVIAYRKSCDADGTGLSHYIMMDKNVGKST